MSTLRQIEIRGFEELLRTLGKMTDLRDRFYWPLHDAMAQSSQLLESRMKENLTRHDSVASGNLRAGVQSTPPRITETEIAISVGPDQAYAPKVEFGTKPHWTPLESLIEWVRLKHLAGVYSIRTGRRLGSKEQQRAEDVALAKAVQWKIYRHGTRARPFIIPAVDESTDDIQRLFEDAVYKLVLKFNEGGA